MPDIYCQGVWDYNNPLVGGCGYNEMQLVVNIVKSYAWMVWQISSAGNYVGVICKLMLQVDVDCQGETWRAWGDVLKTGVESRVVDRDVTISGQLDAVSSGSVNDTHISMSVQVDINGCLDYMLNDLSEAKIEVYHLRSCLIKKSDERIFSK